MVGFPFFLFSQEYNVSQYSIGEGLSQSQVRAIFQDKRGFIWLGTHRGVSRFDGKNFTDFQPENGLAGRFVTAITGDKQGNIWFGTESGLSRFDGVHFQNFTKENGLTSYSITSLLYDDKGILWMGTKNGMLFQYHDNAIFPIESSLKSEINALIQGKDGRIWIGTSLGLMYYQDGEVQQISEFQNTEIRAILLDKERLWLGTNKGIMRYEEKRGKVIFSQNIPDNNIFCLVRDKDATIWAGTRIGMVRLVSNVQVAAGDTVLVTQTATFTAKNWSLRNTVQAAAIDTEGNLWVGTEGKGVYKIRKGIFTTVGIAEGLNSEIAKSFLEDDNGNIWISTTDNGINQFAPTQPKPYHVSYLNKQNGFPCNDICSSFRDKEGNFWFASYTNGLTQYDGKNYKTYTIQNGLGSNKAYCVKEDANGRIWVGTEHGISIIDGDKFQYLTNKDGLISNAIYTILHDKKGSVWMGTGEGISVLMKDGSIRNYSTKDSLGDNLVLSLKEDSKGNIWAATSHGLSVWNGKKWQNILLPASIAANDIVALVFEQNDNYVWLGTNNGIFRLEVGDFLQNGKYALAHFTTADGLPSLECNGNAAYRDKKGNIWLGTIAGAVCYSPFNQQIEAQAPPLVYITGVKLFFKDIYQSKLTIGEINLETGLPKSLSLPYNQNHITFDFIGICHSRPSSVRYKIRLKGFEENWQPITEETKFTYSNLPSGTYTFLVKATNDMGKWVDAAPFTFIIQKPFWATWWFILLMLTMISAIGYAIYFAFQERANQQREQAQIQTKADSLQLEQQALYAMMNPHFTFNALQSIQYFIMVQDKMSATKFLTQFAKLVRMNLDSSKSEFISLNDEIERLKLYLSLEKMRFQDKFDYFLEVQEEIDKSETLIPPMILQPFVENSLKHGIMPLEGNGQIIVNIKEEDENTLLVSIRDNGIGISASKKMKADRPNDHVSQGMTITQDRLKLFSKTTGKAYTIDFEEIQKEDGTIGGTLVTIRLPMKSRL